VKTISKTLNAVLATAAILMAPAIAQASQVSYVGSTVEGDSFSASFHFNLLGNIDSISGTVFSVALGSGTITGLLDPSEDGVLYDFDQMWHPGFDLEGLAFDWGAGHKANLYMDAGITYFSVDASGLAWNPGHAVRGEQVTTVPDANDPGGTVPEPASAVLAIAGLGLLAVSRRLTATQKTITQ
jgi:hypothetical protein